MRHLRRRRFRVIPLLLLGLLALALAPVAVVETSCRATPGPAAPPGLAIPGPDYRREPTNSYLSYPEWYLVYAYQDFAAILEGRDEYAFDYTASIAGFWTSFCGVNRIASARGGGDAVEKAMLYIIGDSFTVEMALKGAWETTIGRATAALRGPIRTPEDTAAHAVASEYAAFLNQTPWYEYPFADRLRSLWHTTPFGAASPLRATERRIELTLEWGVKALYAKALRAAAGLAPADLRIQSVIRGLDADDQAAIPDIKTIRAVGDDQVLIETPRYAAFTTILTELAARHRDITEIAGNQAILVTALLPPGIDAAPAGPTLVFSGPVQFRPGWRRIGLDVAVPDLTALIRLLQDQGAVFEHAYDY